MNRAAWWPFGAPSEGARLRLVCLPYAGGGASVFRRWREAAGPAIDICAVQLPGREGRIREAPFRRMEPLVEALLEELHPWIHLPYAVFGHSMGALVGFELAHRARALRLPGPRALFVSAARAPHLPARAGPIHALPEPEFISALRDLDGTPEAVLEHRELMDLLLPVLRADFEVCEAYEGRDGEALACPITAFHAPDDPSVSEEDIRGWAAHSSTGFRAIALPGGHFFLESRYPEIVDRIRESTARTGKAASEPRGEPGGLEGPKSRPQPGS